MARRRRPPAGGMQEQPRSGSASGSAPRHGLLGVGIAAAVTGSLVLAATPAYAQAFGPGACGGGCFYADNSNETFYYLSLSLTDINSTELGRYRLDATDMSTQVQASSYNSDTDVIVEDANYGSGRASAWWYCATWVSGSNNTKCNQGHIIFNQYFTSNEALACQEIGHGVGLDHSTSSGSCMYQNAAVAARDYDAHDKGHINGYY
jgi:hypothetical protein